MSSPFWHGPMLTLQGEVPGSKAVDFESLPGLPPLIVSTLCTDVTTHLEGVQRQGGGIGSTGFDEKQKDIRAFFGGAQAE